MLDGEDTCSTYAGEAQTCSHDTMIIISYRAWLYVSF
jgi:hypothetical protein